MMKTGLQLNRQIIMKAVGMDYSYGALDVINSYCCCTACCIDRGGTVFL